MGIRLNDLLVYVDYRVSENMILKGKYGFRVTLIFADGSKKVKEHGGFIKKTDANKARELVISQLHQGIYVAHDQVKVEELLDFWLEQEMRTRKSFKANSYHTYRNCIDRHIVPKIGKLKLTTLNQGHLNRLYKTLAQSYASIPKLVKTILNTAMNFAVGKKLISRNPCEGVDIPKTVKKSEYHTITIKETQTYTLEEVKKLLAAARNSRIHVQVVLALLMGLRRSEINGLKYSDIDFANHKMHLDRQLGEDLHADPETIPPKMKTKQEIPLKTKSSYREMDIPDYVYWVLVEERKKYEKNRSRRQHGRWIFQDLDYVCCSSYGRPRSKTYHYQHYAELIKEAELPYIKFHDLRHTYTTILMKNNINQRAIATALGHSKSIITVDTYTDMKMIIEDCVEELQVFISEIHPYDMTDKKMLEEMFHETIALEDSGDAVYSSNHIPGIVIYDYSDVYEMEDIAEWYMGEGKAV